MNTLLSLDWSGIRFLVLISLPVVAALAVVLS
jgi:hypothetical protein